MIEFQQFVVILGGVTLLTSLPIYLFTGFRFFRNTLLTSVVILAAAVASMILSG